MSFKTYRKLRDRWTVEMLARRPAPCSVPVPCRIHIRRLICRMPQDLDNLFSTAKIPLDALRHAGVIPDDDPEAVTSLQVTQERAPSRKHEATIIELYPC